MTIILDGGGGCWKTTQAVDVLFPLMEMFFGIHCVLRRAPSNKLARLIGGRTMHSSQGLTPQDSLRTNDLVFKSQARMKLTKTHINAGAMYVDEYSQLPCEINHAAALRTTHARENAYGLNKSFYHTPRERYRRNAVLAYGGDRLQCPPVPESLGLLASI